MLGLLLILLDVLSRLQGGPPGAGRAPALVVLLAAAGATHARAAVWADPVPFGRTPSRKSPNKPRAHFHLALCLLRAGARCDLAVAGVPKDRRNWRRPRRTCWWIGAWLTTA